MKTENRYFQCSGGLEICLPNAFFCGGSDGKNNRGNQNGTSQRPGHVRKHGDCLREIRSAMKTENRYSIFGWFENLPRRRKGCQATQDRSLFGIRWQQHGHPKQDIPATRPSAKTQGLFNENQYRDEIWKSSFSNFGVVFGRCWPKP